MSKVAPTPKGENKGLRLFGVEIGRKEHGLFFDLAFYCYLICSFFFFFLS